MSDDGRTAVDSETTLQRNPYRNAAVVTAVAAAATLLPHLLLWGPPWHASSGSWHGVGAPDMRIRGVGLVAVLPLSIVTHEFLHMVGYVWFGKAAWHQVRFDIRWRSLVVYARCRAPLTQRALVLAAVLPAVVLGVLPSAAGIATGTWWLTAYGFTMLVVASGDLTLIWRFARSRTTP